MHIVYIVADRGIPLLGSKGASIHIQQIVFAFESLGHDVTVVCARIGGGENPRRLTLQKVQAEAVLPSSEYSGANAKVDARERQSMADATAIVSHVVKLHESRKIDLVYERFALFSRAGSHIATVLKIPFVIEVNAPLRQEQRQYRTLLNEAAARSVEADVLRSADRVIAVSQPVADFARTCGANKTRIYVLPNAVDPQHFHPHCERTNIPFADGHFVVGFTGSLKPWHGLEYLLRAMQILVKSPAQTDIRLVVVGTGPLEEWMSGFIAGAGLENNVSMLGWVDFERLPGVLKCFDVAVAPYPDMGDFYFSPLKLYEYMAMALPVIASDVGQISEVLEHQSSGMLVTPADPKALADCIENLRAAPELRAALGSKARARSLRNTWKDTAAESINGILEVAVT